jgi:ubiquinone/menaquinone biosynthesis C-methylase UbiE
VKPQLYIKKYIVTMNEKVRASYSKHKKQLENRLLENENFDYDWLDNHTYDTWRHKRMYALLDSIINVKDSWLTIGDGRYGSDAHYLFEKGVEKVMASDISDALLKTAKKHRYFPRYKEINAEAISLKDNSYDFILCKESYHHFPRPMVALYEMIRVAKKGVVLIEPNDTKALVNKRYENSFEEVGNYKYPISIREIEKVTSAIGLKHFAYKGLDDIYLPQGGLLDISALNIDIIRVKFILWLMDILYRLGVREKSVVCLVIFKLPPQKNLIDMMVNQGFNFIINKDNPYV